MNGCESQVSSSWATLPASARTLAASTTAGQPVSPIAQCRTMDAIFVGSEMAAAKKTRKY